MSSLYYFLVFLVISLPTALPAPRRRASKYREVEFQPYCYEIVRKDGSNLLQNVKPSKYVTDPTDKAALEALYHTTAGPLWKKQERWLKGDPCQDMWYGIKCSEEGRVIEINLFGNSLVGQLPPELGDLTSLQGLRLYNNMISGGVPQQMFNLKHIQVLDLDFNNIQGNLPAEFSSPELINFTIACNYFEGFLPTVWNTPKLQYLNIYNNLFTGPIPEGLGSAVQLLEMDLSENYFSSILPSKLGNLKNLKKFHLSDNQNKFSEIPDDWEGMESLQQLTIEGGIGGYFPYWIGTGWENLQVLDLNFGPITGYLSDNICKLSKLNTLRLSSNSLEGELPKCICDMSPHTLTNLELNGNAFTGSIPDCLNKLVNLTTLDLSSNKFSGPLPQSIAGLKRLTNIDFSGNTGLYGGIPPEYSQLEGQLQQLSLSETHLTSFGEGLGGLLKTLSSCYLYDVPFHCPLPAYLNGTNCRADCTHCGTEYTTCGGCVSDEKCGWCTDGHALCLEGTATRVNYTWDCSDSDWIYGNRQKCPTQSLL